MSVFGFNPFFDDRICAFGGSIRCTDTDDSDVVIAGYHHVKDNGFDGARFDVVFFKNEVILHFIEPVHNLPFAINRVANFGWESADINRCNIVDKHRNCLRLLRLNGGFHAVSNFFSREFFCRLRDYGHSHGFESCADTALDVLSMFVFVIPRELGDDSVIVFGRVIAEDDGDGFRRCISNGSHEWVFHAFGVFLVQIDVGKPDAEDVTEESLHAETDEACVFNVPHPCVLIQPVSAAECRCKVCRRVCQFDRVRDTRVNQRKEVPFLREGDIPAESVKLCFVENVAVREQRRGLEAHVIADSKFGITSAETVFR